MSETFIGPVGDTFGVARRPDPGGSPFDNSASGTLAAMANTANYWRVWKPKKKKWIAHQQHAKSSYQLRDMLSLTAIFASADLIENITRLEFRVAQHNFASYSFNIGCNHLVKLPTFGEPQHHAIYDNGVRCHLAAMTLVFDLLFFSDYLCMWCVDAPKLWFHVQTKCGLFAVRH